jgi:hypothetical protein
LNWTAGADKNWVTVSPASGQNAGNVTVSINANANSLAPGTTYSSTVTFAGNGGSITRQVQLTVIAQPVLAVSPPDGLSSSGNQGGPFSPASKSYAVSNTGGGTLNWTASADQSWVTVSPASGQNSGNISVSINGNANSLAGGTTYSSTVTFSSDGGSTTRQVQLAVVAPPVLAVSPPDGLSSSGAQGGPFSPVSKSYTVSNTGGGTLNWTASADQSWVTVSPASGQNSGNVSVSISANANSLASGTTYSSTVTFSGNGGSTTRQVQLSVSPTQAPPNDNFAQRIALSGAVVATTGQNTNATKEPGEPNHAGATGGKSVWWSWTAPAPGTVTISTAGSTFDTVLGIYTGSSVSSLVTITSNDDANPGTDTSMVVLPVVAGTEYEIAVDGYGAAYGEINLSIGLEVLPNHPALRIAYLGNEAMLSWGTNWTGYVLESAKSLASGAAWDLVSPAPVLAGTNNVVTNAMTRPTLFYRLRHQ